MSYNSEQCEFLLQTLLKEETEDDDMFLLLNASKFKVGSYQSRLCWKIMLEEEISNIVLAGNYPYKVKEKDVIVARRMLLQAHYLSND